MLEWDDLRYVLAVAEGGSLSKAAVTLKVSHPTVFRRIQQIEEKLGTRLFERHSNGYVITPAGEEARALALRLRDDVLDLEQRLAGHDNRPSGVVRITTTDTLGTLVLPHVFAGVRQDNPGLVLEVSIAKEFLSLARREADIAIRASNQPTETLIGRRLGTLTSSIYAAESLIGRTKGLKLTEQDWIGFDDSLSHLASAKWMAKEIPPERIVYRANLLTAVWGAARAGVGLAILPSYMGVCGQGLTRIGESLPEWDTGLWVLTHRDLKDQPRIRSTVDSIVRHFKPFAKDL